MKQKINLEQSSIKKALVVALFTLAVVGCKTTEPHYYYGQYNTTVYNYFKADETTIEQQITVLEEVIQEATSNNKRIAPGIHAHLGMLYFQTGDNNLGAQHFDQEKQLFPESTQYIDFLLTQAKKA